MAPTTILICDDSRTYATALRSLLEHDRELQVVGISPSGEHALESIRRLRPSLVTMDLELPGIDGVETIRQIMRSDPVPVVVLSAHAQRGSRDAAAALAAGAVEALPKTRLRVAQANSPAAVDLRRQLKLLAQARVRRSDSGTATASAPGSGAAAFPAEILTRPIRAIAIGSSTGGPRALRSVLSPLPATFPIPILVVQHIGDQFLDAFVRWLAGELEIPVRTAVDGEQAHAGVSVAPAGSHLQIEPSMLLHLDGALRSGPHRPSVNILLESMAGSLGSRAFAAVLTGMGSDGARGVAAMRAAGGVAVAQDEASSVVFGMPRAAAEQGARLLTIEEISSILTSLGRRNGHR